MFILADTNVFLMLCKQFTQVCVRIFSIQGIAWCCFLLNHLVRSKIFHETVCIISDRFFQVPWKYGIIFQESNLSFPRGGPPVFSLDDELSSTIRTDFLFGGFLATLNWATQTFVISGSWRGPFHMWLLFLHSITWLDRSSHFTRNT